MKKILYLLVLGIVSLLLLLAALLTLYTMVKSLLLQSTLLALETAFGSLVLALMLLYLARRMLRKFFQNLNESNKSH